MKFKGDRKYLYYAMTGLAIVGGGLILYYLLFHWTDVIDLFNYFIGILNPFILGFTIAYILTPIVNTLEHRAMYPIYKKIKKENAKPFRGKLRKKFRVFSVILSYLILIFVLAALVWMIIPELMTNISNLGRVIPSVFNNIYSAALSFVKDGNAFTDFLKNSMNIDVQSIIRGINLNDIISSATGYLSGVGDLIGGISSTIMTTVKTTINVIIGIVASVYFLADKEKFAAQAKKFAFAIFERKNANRLIKDFRFIHKTFIGFIAGKIVDSAIMGVLCFIGLSILHTPYAVLISVYVGVTNVIPFFGPYLGAIPSAVLLLMVSPPDCLVFVIFIIILQQIDGNIIGPKILGNTTGLSGFWVIFGITVFGAIYGIFGMFVGVPVFAVIYAFVRRFLNRKLKNKDLPDETAEYAELYQMGENKEFLTKEHMYIEIRNPDGIKKNDNDDGKYHFSISKMWDKLISKVRKSDSSSTKKSNKTTKTSNENSNESKKVDDDVKQESASTDSVSHKDDKNA